jgi:guanylate kinase
MSDLMNCLVVAGPSGVGKSTLIREALGDHHERWQFSVSATTRKPREGETDGEDYFFLSEAEFIAKVNAGEFVEYANVYGRFYGTLASQFDDAAKAGKWLLVEVDTIGCLNIKSVSPRTPIVALIPPDYRTLRSRLLKRGTDDELEIDKRQANVWMELTRMRHFDFAIVNDDLKVAVKQLVDLMHLIEKGICTVESRVDDLLTELKELSNEA